MTVTPFPIVHMACVRSNPPRGFHLEYNLGPSCALVHPLQSFPYLASSFFITERAFDLDDLVRRLPELTAVSPIKWKTWKREQRVTLLLTIARVTSSSSLVLSSKLEELNQPVRQNPRTCMSLNTSRNGGIQRSSLDIAPNTTNCAPLLARRTVSFVAWPPTQSRSKRIS